MKKRKWLASLLAVVMVLAMMPTMAFAAEDTVEVSNGMTFTSDTTQSNINTWANGAAIITNNTDGTYTVTLQKNITLQQGATSPITFGNYRDADGAKQPTMILDLNGFTVSGKTIVISNMGNLIIRDSKGTGKVVYDGGQYLAAVQNAGYSLTIEGGTFECNGANSAAYNAAISAAASTETVINGGVFDGNGAGALIAYGDVTVNSGTFNGAYGVVSKKASDDSTGSITFPETSTAVVNAEKMALVVEGDDTAAGTISANGGTFNAPNVVGKIGSNVTPQDQVVIAGGSYTADPSAFVADNTALIGLTNNATTQYAAGNDAQVMAQTAKEGDTITVLQGDTITVPDKVKVKNQTGSEITVNGETVQVGVTIDAHVHSYGETWSSDKDNHWHECSCGEKTDTAAHIWGEWTVTKEATEAEKGSRERSCTVCNYKATEEIPMLTHTHSYGTEWKSDGTNHWHECSCGAKADESAHTFAWITDKEATANEKGSKHEECTVCGYAKVAVEIPATGTTEQPTKPEDKPTTDVPQTGDNSNMIVWIAVMLMAGAGMTGTLVYSRKRKHSR